MLCCFCLHAHKTSNQPLPKASPIAISQQKVDTQTWYSLLASYSIAPGSIDPILKICSVTTANANTHPPRIRQPWILSSANHESRLPVNQTPCLCHQSTVNLVVSQMCILKISQPNVLSPVKYESWIQVSQTFCYQSSMNPEYKSAKHSVISHLLIRS